MHNTNTREIWNFKRTVNSELIGSPLAEERCQQQFCHSLYHMNVAIKFMARGNRIMSSILSLLMPTGFALCLLPAFAFSLLPHLSHPILLVTRPLPQFFYSIERAKKAHKILPFRMRTDKNYLTVWR